MIFGDLHDYERERQLYPASIVRALDFLQQADWSTLANGTYDLGDQIIVNVVEMETVPASERKAERHFRYIDIQYLISGEEAMGVTRYSDQLRISDDWSDRDAYLFEEIENETFIRMQPGQFAVFLPHDE